MLGLGLLWGAVLGGGGGAFSAQAQQFFDRAPTIPPGDKTLWAAFIDGLVADGLWDDIDAIKVFAAFDSSVAGINIKSSSFATTLTNSPTFTQYRGFNGNGSSSYVRSGFNPATAGGVLTLNSAFMLAWGLTARAANTTALSSAYAMGPEVTIYPRYTGDVTYTRINDSGGAVANANSDGCFIGNRTGSGSRETFRNGVSLGVVSAAPSSLPNQEIYICAANIDGSPGAFTTDRVAAWAVGRGLTAGKPAALTSRLTTLLTAVGAV